MKRYAMMVLGCKVNDYEAHSLKDRLDKEYQEVKFNEEADIYIIFTCCVTNVAEAKTRKFIHRVKREHPDAYLVVVGCYVQARHDAQVLKDIDLIVGSQYKDKIKEYIDQGIKADLYKEEIDRHFETLPLNTYKGKTRSFLKVQDGCDQYCSYCVIPYARGHERSGDIDELYHQAKVLSEHSKEIVLTGIHTGRYKDKGNKLSDLIARLEKIETIETIRLSSIEVTEVDDDIIRHIKEGKLAPHLHIPLQAGSDTVLKDMHRPYTIEEYKRRIFKIKEEVPEILISTDLIVGYPTETDELFEETLENLKDLRFSFIHCFPYAKKSGTKAALLKDLGTDIKKERARRVAALDVKIARELQDSYLNKTLEVLIEEKKEGFSFGHSKEYLPLYVMGDHPSGDLLKIKVIKVKDGKMIGEVE